MEGGALGVAVVDHFRTRGATVVATSHYDALKTYASTTEGVVSSAFGFNPETFAPTYELLHDRRDGVWHSKSRRVWDSALRRRRSAPELERP